MQQALTKYFKNKIMLITNKHVSIHCIKLNININRTEIVLSFKYLGVITHEKSTVNDIHICWCAVQS